MTGTPLLSVRDLRKEFVTGRGGLARHRTSILAVDDISFDVAPGEVLGLVGESGCGKTTTGRLILRLVEPSSGSIRYRDRDLLALSPAEMRAMRKELQIIFQDPFGALNPRMTAGELVIEPLVVHGVGDSASRETRLREVLDLVGLSSWHAGRYPHEFSGGQRQRLCIARALVLNPSLVVCDEAVSALDVSVQAQILNLLQDLRNELGLTYLFISHDLGVVHHISDRVAVMYLGQIVEIADKQSLFDAPAHPYTQALLGSVPSAQKGRKSFFTIPGDVPSAANPPTGCRFHTRCPMAQDKCKTDPPRLRPLPDGRLVSCHFAETSQANHARQTE